jgi:hypothetical protein
LNFDCYNKIDIWLYKSFIETSALLEDQENDPYKICNPDNRPPSEDPSSMLELNHCHSISDELTTVQIKSNSFRIHVKWEETSEQVLIPC